MRKIMLMLVGLLLIPAAAFGQDDTNLDDIQAGALAQIEVDLSQIGEVPENSTPEYQRDLLRNKRITAHYAELYLSNPDQFQWAGLAAYVSNEVGNQMQIFQEAGFALLYPSTYQSIVDANIAVYADLYWQHDVYRQFGLDELERAYTDEMLGDTMIGGWRLIDMGDAESVEGGTRAFAEYEQGVILQQALYDPEFDFFDALPPTTVFASPIPGHDADFAGENIAIFEERWDWTLNDLLPGWLAYLDSNAEQAQVDLLMFVLNANADAYSERAAEIACEGDAACAAMALDACGDDLTVACLLSAAE